MSLVNIRTTTAFINNPDVSKMDSFIDGVKKIEEEIKIRTKRVSLKIEDFSDKSINKISKDVENLGYWGFSVSFNDPTDEDIEISMRGNLCRCMTYHRIKNAIKKAGKTIRARSV